MVSFTEISLPQQMREFKKKKKAWRGWDMWRICTGYIES